MKDCFAVLDIPNRIPLREKSRRRIQTRLQLVMGSVLFVLASNVLAQHDSLKKVPSFVTFNTGAFNVVNAKRLQGQFEIEFYPNLEAWFFYPFAGAFITTNSSASVFAGITIPVVVNKRLLVRLSFAPGLYTSTERKSDLGYLLEFRTSLKIAYVFRDQSRLGVQFSHISNANLNWWNPGAEVLVVSYEIPLRIVKVQELPVSSRGRSWESQPRDSGMNSWQAD